MMPVSLPQRNWPRPGGSDIHIWIVRPDVSARADDRLLSDDEVARAARFASQPRREQFAYGRTALRTILAGCLDADPKGLVFGQGVNGKPYLRDAPAVAFNLSHSDGLTLVVVGRDMRIGVDVEALHRSADFEDLARRFFAPSEAASIEKLPQQSRTRAFLTAWTRKEALAKAAGDDVAAVLGTAVSIDELPAGQRIAYRAEQASAPEDWFMYAPEMPVGYIASIALSRQAGQLGVHHFPPPPRPDWPKRT